MGRPSKLTPTITRAILVVLAAGGTRAVAAKAAGISESTLYNGCVEALRTPQPSSKKSPTRTSTRSVTCAHRHAPPACRILPYG